MRKAIILGGNADQVPLIQALAGRGYRTILIDYYPDPPGRTIADVHYQVSTLDVAAVCAVVEKERPEFLASIGNDLVVPVLAEVSERYGLPCTQDHAHAMKATNKAKMKAAFREHGIPTAPLFGKEQYTGTAKAGLPYPLIGKLLVGYGAQGVRRLNDATELDAYLTEYAREGEVLVESFIEGGAELSVDCFAVDGQVSLLMISRLHQVPGLHQQFSNLLVEFPYAVPERVQQALKDIAARMSIAFGIPNGPFFFQAKLKGGALQVIEMGARIAGGRKYSAVKATTGFDPLEAQLDVLEGKKPVINIAPAGRYYITVMLFALLGTIAHVQIPRSPALLEHFMVKGTPYLSQGSGTGRDRIAVLTVTGTERDSALRNMAAILEDVRMENEQGESLLWKELYSGQW